MKEILDVLTVTRPEIVDYTDCITWCLKTGAVIVEV